MKKTKTKSKKEHCILSYIEGSDTKLKKFTSTEKMGKFVDDFYKKYPNYASYESDNWIDFAITGVSGDVFFFTDGLKLE